MKKILKYIEANLKVYFAYITNNKSGKREDIHGREYGNVYKKMGHKKMVEEYILYNSWNISFY